MVLRALLPPMSKSPEEAYDTRATTLNTRAGLSNTRLQIPELLSRQSVGFHDSLVGVLQILELLL